MSALRAWTICIALMLAACANTAPPESVVPAEAGTRNAVVPAQAGTRSADQTLDPRLRGDDEKRPPPPPTGGPHPPQRFVPTCKTDADCIDKPHCQAEPCKCVRETCIAPKPAIDPVIDPAPVPPPET